MAVTIWQSRHASVVLNDDGRGHLASATLTNDGTHTLTFSLTTSNGRNASGKLPSGTTSVNLPANAIGFAVDASGNWTFTGPGTIQVIEDGS